MQKLSMVFAFWAILAPPSLADTLAGGGGHAPSAAEWLVREEQKLLALINSYRREQDLRPLTWSDRLAEAAAGHNDEMVRHDQFGHCSPDERCLPDRLGEVGYRFLAAAENLAAGQRSALSVLRAWQNSDGHDANLLAEQMTEAGIDLDPREVEGASRLWTLVLARPAP